MVPKADLQRAQCLGGGKPTSTRQSACERPEASMNQGADTLGQVLQWAFLHIHIYQHQHNDVRHVPCVGIPSLEPIRHPPSLAHCCPLLHNMAVPVNNEMMGIFFNS